MSTRINVTVGDGGLLDRNAQQTAANRQARVLADQRATAEAEGVERRAADRIAAGLDPLTGLPASTPSSASTINRLNQEPAANRRPDGIGWLLPTNFEFNSARIGCKVKSIKNAGLFPVLAFADPEPTAVTLFELVNGGIVAFQKVDIGAGLLGNRFRGAARAELALGGNALSIEYATFNPDGSLKTPDIYYGSTGVLSRTKTVTSDNFNSFSLEIIGQSGIGTSSLNPNLRFDLFLDEVAEDGSTIIGGETRATITLLMSGSAVFGALNFVGGNTRENINYLGLEEGTPTQKQHVKIAVINKTARMYVDGRLIWESETPDAPLLKPGKKYHATLDIDFVHRTSTSSGEGPNVDFAPLYGARLLTGSAVTAPSESFSPPETLTSFN
jgi:hypothetical protein